MRKKALKITKVDGTSNLADALTKALDQEGIRKHMEGTDQHKSEGRHAMAPEAVDDDVIGVGQVGEQEWEDEDHDGIESLGIGGDRDRKRGKSIRSQLPVKKRLVSDPPNHQRERTVTPEAAMDSAGAAQAKSGPPTLPAGAVDSLEARSANPQGGMGTQLSRAIVSTQSLSPTRRLNILANRSWPL